KSCRTPSSVPVRCQHLTSRRCSEYIVYNHPMSGTRYRMLTLLLTILATLPLAAQKPASFEVEEATIANVHEAMKAGRLTCRALVGQYLKRIEAYDKNGPAI